MNTDKRCTKRHFSGIFFQSETFIFLSLISSFLKKMMKNTETKRKKLIPNHRLINPITLETAINARLLVLAIHQFLHSTVVLCNYVVMFCGTLFA